ncbi:MAG: AAA family ATPase [Steroidobacteraceae bacterium]
MASEISLHMESVARHYWGKPSFENSKVLRWGNKKAREVDKAKGTWYDHEYKRGGGVVDLVRLEEGAQIGGIASILQRKFGIEPRRVEALKPAEFVSRVFDYADEWGEIRYQVVRFEPRRFLQRRPSGHDYVYNMTGVEPLPYNLPEILKRANDPIYIVEGEKCADSLISRGLLATTSHGGAGNWRPAINKWFEGRDVVVIPDNDEPGRMHADRVVENLIGTAKTVRRVNLNGLQEKGDIFDWLNFGNTVENLSELSTFAPVLSSPSAPSAAPAAPDAAPVRAHHHIADPADAGGRRALRVLSLRDVMALPPIEWLIDGLIPRGGLAVLYGPPGSGKSFAALDIAAAIAWGTLWHGRETIGGPVVYIAGEGVGGQRARIKALRAARGLTSDAPFVLIDEAVALTDRDGVEDVLAALTSLGERHALIIIDTVARMMSGSDENDAREMGLFVAACDAIRRHSGAAVLAIHHSNKGRGDMRGSSALLGAVDTSIKATQTDGVLELTVEKQKDGEMGDPLRFAMTPIALVGGSSIVLEREGGGERSGKQPRKLRPLPVPQQIALQALEDAIIKSPTPRRRVAVIDWHAAHLARCGDWPAPKRSAARAALQAAGRVIVADGEVWIAPD